MGCGNSAGTPAIGNYWGNCDPAEPRNLRTRASALVQSEQTTLVIDTGADFRAQINRHNVKTIDAVLYTHAHGDHIYGIDELRVVRNRTKKLVNIYAGGDTLHEIHERFAYMFVDKDDGLYARVLEPHIIEKPQMGKSMKIGDISFMPFEQDHGTCVSLGFRFGDLAYSTDMVTLDTNALDVIRGVKTWVVDGAGYKMTDNRVHATLRHVYELNEKVGAIRVIITHLTPAMDYQNLRRELPEGYEPAFDGMPIDIY